MSTLGQPARSTGKAGLVCHLLSVLTGGNLMACGECWEKVMNFKSSVLVLEPEGLGLGHAVLAEKQSLWLYKYDFLNTKISGCS